MKMTQGVDLNLSIFKFIVNKGQETLKESLR